MTTVAELKGMSRRQRRRARSAMSEFAAQPSVRVQRARRGSHRVLLLLLAVVFAGAAVASIRGPVGDYRSGALLAGLACFFFAGSRPKRGRRL